MIYQFSFGYIKILSKYVAEVMIDNNIDVTKEMVEEFDNFLSNQFNSKMGLLVNNINHYTYTDEAQLSIALLENINAIAIVNYHPRAVESAKQLRAARANNDGNIKEFSGLELGYHQALVWLDRQLKYAKNDI